MNPAGRSAPSGSFPFVPPLALRGRRKTTTRLPPVRFLARTLYAPLRLRITVKPITSRSETTPGGRGVAGRGRSLPACRRCMQEKGIAGRGDLGPPRPPRLAAAGCDEHHPLEAAFRACPGPGGVDLRDRVGDLRVRQCPVVLHAARWRRQRGGDGPARGVAPGTVAVGLCPVEDVGGAGSSHRGLLVHWDFGWGKIIRL